LVYVPKDTLLIQQARSAGATAVSGLSMLVYQGALAFTIFTGLPAPVGVMEQVAENAIK
jgi:shikimate dehydrogenase